MLETVVCSFLCGTEQVSGWLSGCHLPVTGLFFSGGPMCHLLLPIPVFQTNIFPGWGRILFRHLQWPLAGAARKLKRGLHRPLRDQTPGS